MTSTENAPTIQFLIGVKAVNVINQSRVQDALVDQWKADQGITAFVLRVGTKIASFALLSKQDFDPMKEFSNPKTLNFIYTCPEYRRKGHAAQLLKHIMDEKMVEFTAFCSSYGSEELFRKCGCRDFGEYNHTRMFRPLPRTT